MSDKEDMRKVISDELDNVDFPVKNKMTLASKLPSGPGTVFKTENITVSAMELATYTSSELDFPYEDEDELVKDSINALDGDGFFEE